MNKKVFTLTAMTVLSSGILLACGNTASTNDKVLNVALNASPATLNPQLADDTPSGAVIDQMFEGLMRLDPQGKIVPALAEKYEVSEDGKTYTFHLRDAKWSNGDPITAQDVEYTWKKTLTPETKAGYAYQLYPIKGAKNYTENHGNIDEIGVKAIDDKTLEVNLEHPTAYFLEALSSKPFYPINSKIDKTNPDWYKKAETFVVSSAFKLDKREDNKQFILSKNDSYWDAANVKLEGVNVQIVPDSNTVVNMFQSKAIDFIGSPFQKITPDAIDSLKQNNKIIRHDFASVYWIQYNTKHELLANKNLRRALGLAINRDEIVKNIVKAGTVAQGLTSPTMPGYHQEGYFKDHDVAAAKAALNQALTELGKSKPSDITIKLSFNTDDLNQRIIQAVQEQWKKELGINVEINNTEWNVYLSSLKEGQFEASRLYWVADYNDPIAFLNIFEVPENTHTRWINTDYTTLLTQANDEQDTEKRLALLNQAEQLLMDEMPISPIYYQDHISLAQDNIKDSQPNPVGTMFFKYVTKE